MQTSPNTHTDATSYLTTGFHALTTGDIGLAEHYFRHVLHENVRSAAAWRGLAETQSGARRAICLRWAALAEAAATPTTLTQAHSRLQTQSARLYRTMLRSSLAVAGLLTLALIGSDIAYRDRVLPNVSIGPITVENQALGTVDDLLAQQEQQLTQRFILIEAQGKRWKVPLDALLVDQRADFVQVAEAYGHQAGFWSRALTRTQALLGKQVSFGAATANIAAVQQVIDHINAQTTQPRLEAQLLRTTNGWIITPEQIGITFDRTAAATTLARLVTVSAWSQQDSIPTLTIDVQRDEPQRTAEQLIPIRDRLQVLASQPLELTYGERSWMLDRSLLMASDATGTNIVQPSTAAIAPELDSIAAAITVAPQPSYLERVGDRVKTFVPGRPGVDLDREAAQQAIENALRMNLPRVELPVRTVAPPPGEAEQLGLIAELGRGESQFLTYSSPERDANVQVGGNDIDGLLLAPGEVFSFTQTVGSITAEKGYRWGEAIEAGVIVPSLGGGICQVSTTTFRAAFWSGLEIVERYNHSWRLPWYEVDAPVGMDATIALGGPDLKWRNNTAHYVLIKVETDLVQKRQTVILYGTPDGRRVEMQPLQSNIGVERRVIQGNNVLTDEAFVSYYSQ